MMNSSLRLGLIAAAVASMACLGREPDGRALAQTSQATEVTAREGTNFAIALSPDARSIAMDLQGVLFVLPATGGPARRLLPDDLYDARQPAWSADGRTIAFQSNRDGTWHIWSVAATGGEPKPFTSGPSDNREPHWSPDGTRLAFSSNRSGNYDIWELRVQTGELRQVTTSSEGERNPAYSPDGQEIAYLADRNRRSVIAAMSSANTERILAAPSGGPGAPSWAPDGRQVLYSLVAAGEGGLMLNDRPLVANEDVFPFRPQWISPTAFLYAADGKIKRRSLQDSTTTTIEFTATFPVQRPTYARTRVEVSPRSPQPVLGLVKPTISPDGRQVAFAALGDLWIMTIGSTPQRLNDDPHVDTDPAWSPDGRRVVYASDRAGTMDLWIHDLSSGQRLRLTDAPGAEVRPAWSPDGTRIAYLNGFGTYQGEVFIADVATGRTTKIAEATFGAGYPTWSADGRTVVTSRLLTIAESGPLPGFADGGTNQLWASSTTGGSGRHITLVPHRSVGNRTGNGPVWSPNGRWMAFAMDQALWIMPVTPAGDAAGEPRLLARETADFLSWTGDSQRLLLLASDRLKLIAIADGRVEDVPLDLSWTPATPNGTVLVHTGRLVDGVRATSRADVDVLIEGNRIRAVEPHRDALHTGRVVDASQSVVMPGLIDAHAHFIMTYGSLIGRTFLAYGITGVRNPTNIPYEAIEERESVESGRRPGPRVFYTGYSFEGPRLFWEDSVSVTNTDQIDAEIGRVRQLRYDFLKTYVHLPEPLRKYAVESAHRLGIPASSHEIYPAAAYGTDSTEHITGGSGGRGYSSKMTSLGRIYQDVIELYVKSGITLTPTLSLGGIAHMARTDPTIFTEPRWRLLQPPWGDATRYGLGPPTLNPGRERVAQRIRESLLTLSRAGVTMVAGTDSSLAPYGVSLHNELEQSVLAGLTPFQALQMATVNVAALLNASADLGTVEPGKLADLVIVDGDPLVDIRNARKVQSVIKNGEVITLDEILRVRTHQPR